MRIVTSLIATSFWIASVLLPAMAEAPGPDADRLKPKLYALVIGVSAYAHPALRLTFAAKDARDFAAALAHQEGGLYRGVAVQVLTDGQATAAAVRDGLDWLTRQVTSQDVGVVYINGHGVLSERERFYFLAADSDPARLRATAVPEADIREALDALAGKAVLFVDASHAGAVSRASGRRGPLSIDAALNELGSTERGVVVFAASLGRQVSQESPIWDNGAFTKALVEGLGLPGEPGKADLLGTGTITVSTLGTYVMGRVKELTGGTQSPVLIRPKTLPDFPFAVSRR